MLQRRRHLSLPAARRGFTLIELLVVIVILALLMAIAIPAYLSQQKKAKVSKTKQYLVTAWRSARAELVSNSGSTGYPTSDVLLANLQSDQPQLSFKVGSGATAASSTDQVVIDSSSGGNTLILYAKSATGDIYKLEVDQSNGGAYAAAGDSTHISDVGSGLTGYDAVIAADSPTTFWRLNETGAPASVADSSGHGYGGTTSGSFTAGVSSSNPTTSVSGNTHFLFPFVGSGSVSATGSQYACVSGCTVEVWWLPSASQTNQRFIDTSPLFGGYGIEAQYDGSSQTLTYYVNHGGGGSGHVATVAPGSWVLLDLVYDSATHKLTGYINGAYNSYASDTEADYTTPGLQVQYAEVDDVAFYPTALSAATVAAHYAAR